MATATLGPGLVILREGSLFEYKRRTDKGHWFEDIKTGDYFCLTEQQFFDGHCRQEILVMDAVASTAQIKFANEQPEKSTPADNSLAVATLSTRHQSDLDRKLDYVSQIMALGISRGQRHLLSDAAKRIAQERGDKKAPSAATLNRWMGSYEKGRKEIWRLITKNNRRKCTKRVSAENERLIREAIDYAVYDQGLRRNSQVTDAYTNLVKAENAKREAGGQQLIVPASPMTVIRRIREEPAFEVDVARLGAQEARRKHRMMKGHLPADYALEVAEIDHTQVNLYVIDDLLFLPLGLPWITIIRDRKTGAILGIYVSFRKTSLQSIFGAVRHSLFAHTKIQEQWPEIENPWVSHGVATTYDCDGGADFLSPRYRLTLHGLGAEPRYSARGVPWHKAPIERHAGECSSFVEALPGHNFPFHRTPYGYDARKHAVIRFSSLCFLLHKWICDKYHIQPHSRKLASPLERWHQSIGEMPPPIPPSPDALNILMGEVMTGTLRHDGIQFKNLTYVGTALEAIQKRIGVNQRIEFVPNPNDMGHMHILDPVSKTPSRIDCAQFEYASGKTLHQHEYLCRVARANHNLRLGNVERILLSTEDQIQKEITDALDKKQNADKIRIWKLALQAGINSNDVLHGKTRSIADLLPKNGKRGELPASASPLDHQEKFTDIPRFGWGI